MNNSNNSTGGSAVGGPGGRERDERERMTSER